MTSTVALACVRSHYPRYCRSGRCFDPGEAGRDRCPGPACQLCRPTAGAAQGRKLYVVATDDANDVGPRLPRIQKQYDAVSGPKRLLILEGSAHAQFIFETAQGQRLMQEILRFLGGS